ncbi:hypothetical protein [Spongiactinospora sp. TRM90649]|uniref:hypothetical protein n=1 Tax=Spongiactinospora sp. TRM90649 TaxID=3031114 RepID=UPI0023F737E5|nr:hypothetical protein [Spongiactinospora sp. TRM90649]MDF5756585.1 hypothetical protein [Spongiactinospora sp. TRM90649]
MIKVHDGISMHSVVGVFQELADAGRRPAGEGLELLGELARQRDELAARARAQQLAIELLMGHVIVALRGQCPAVLGSVIAQAIGRDGSTVSRLAHRSGGPSLRAGTGRRGGAAGSGDRALLRKAIEAERATLLATAGAGAERAAVVAAEMDAFCMNYLPRRRVSSCA